MSEREYIRWAVVRPGPEFELEEVIGCLVFRSQAIQLAQKLYWSGDKSVAVVSDPVSNGLEDEKSRSICSCNSEKVLKEDERGTYWHCPECDG